MRPAQPAIKFKYGLLNTPSPIALVFKMTMMPCKPEIKGHLNKLLATGGE